MELFNVPIVLVCNGKGSNGLTLDNNVIKERIISLKENLGYMLKSESIKQNMDFESIILKFEKINSNETENLINNVKLIFYNNNYIQLYDSSLLNLNLDINKSYIRRLAKKLNLNVIDIFYFDNNKIKIELYDFNKRIYDYLVVDKEAKDITGFENEHLLKNYFVGRNSNENLVKILQERSYYTKNYEILQDILKLFGIDLKKLVQAIE